MKKIIALFAFLTIVFAGSQAKAYEPWGFAIFNGTVEAHSDAVQNATLGSKTGVSTCKTFLGLVNWGDCSIKAAMKNGRISKVTSADWERHFVLIYGEKTLRVYGN